MRIIHLASLALSANVASAQNYGTGKFYINNLLNPHLCVRDCEPGGPLDLPDSMCGGIVTESWITLHQTVDDCCNYQLRWMDLAVCKDKANPSTDGTTKWWADNDDGTCYRDCDPSTSPDCKRVPPPIVLYDSASICCSVSLSWVDPKFCNSRAVDSTSGGWIIDWYNQKCIQDCEPSNGQPCHAHDKPETKIFDTPEHCCAAIFWVDGNICVADSLHIDSFSNKWYADWATETCVKDCDASSGLPCKGNPAKNTVTFSSALECCSAKLSWVAPSSCAGFSDDSDGTYPVSPTVSSPCPAPYNKVAKHYVSGDQVTWNGKIYECITSNGRCFQDGYEPWSAFTAGVWNIVGPCPNNLVTPTTASPARSPLVPLTCQTDFDCPNVCVGVPFGNSQKTCQHLGDPKSPTLSPTKFLSMSPVVSCECTTPKTVPNQCELEILIDMLELAFVDNRRLAAQTLRSAFHDAGTFNQTTNEGGANGCLLNHPPMVDAAENFGLHEPVEELLIIKGDWLAHEATCLDVSSADLLQFAAFFAVIRQSPSFRPDFPAGAPPFPGLTAAKREVLIGNVAAPGGINFQWGRPDATACDVSLTGNLPAFSPAAGETIVNRCIASGGEIKKKMIDTNGFTAREATVLIGAHTIGRIRNTFGDVGPWVENGDDFATNEGPIFDNRYHSFLINDITANTRADFALNPPSPRARQHGIPGTSIERFTIDFGSWFQDDRGGNSVSKVSHLDSDIALAFPSEGAYPDFHPFTKEFANNNTDFLIAFHAALDKLSKLGVSATLQLPGRDCEVCTSARIRALREKRALMSDGEKRRLQTVSFEDPGSLNATQIYSLIRRFSDVQAQNSVFLANLLFSRRVEISNFTIPLFVSKAPTPAPV